MKNDDMGDRLKKYENMESMRTLMFGLPVIARMDGIRFHRFTKGLDRPYDIRLANLMIVTTGHLMNHFGATVGYTQSDEITLGWKPCNHNETFFCGGRVMKLATHLASEATAFFNHNLNSYISEKSGYGSFDARVFNVPNLEEAANCFLWREQDAAKNSVSMAAHTYFSWTQLIGKNSKELQEMLWKEKGINWNDYYYHFKRGTFTFRKTYTTPFTAEEIASLPEKHHARNNPNLQVKRTKYVSYANMPIFSKVINRVEVLFFGEEPRING